jgi:hypothetical protein
MLRADKDHIIDIVSSTINVVGPGISFIAGGGALFKQDLTIDGDLIVNGLINGGTGGGTTGTVIASGVISTPFAPVTATDVQTAIDQLAGLTHTQNTDIKLDNGGANEVSASELAQHIQQYIELVDTTGGMVLAYTDSDIPFTTQTHINSNYSHTGGSAIITFNIGGMYQVLYKATTEITNGSHRTNSEFELELDTGGGFLPITGTSSNTTNRTSGSGPSSTSSMNIITVSAGDDLKLVVRKIVVHSLTSTVEMVSGKTSVVITKMD